MTAGGFDIDLTSEFARELIGDELLRLMCMKEAKRLFLAQGSPTTKPRFEVITEVPPGPTWLVQDLIPAEGSVLISAQKKTGKTTMVLNIIKALISGQMFLGEFRTFRKSVVGLVDLEMSPNKLAEWQRDSGLLGNDMVRTMRLRGEARSFDVRDEDRLNELAGEIRDQGIKVLIIDPLGPLLRAYGVPENDNTEVGIVLAALDTMRIRAGADVLIVIHHNGKEDDKGPRGGSVLGDMPDVLWELKKNKSTGLRTLTAEGRDVPEDFVRRLDYDGQTRVPTTLAADETYVPPTNEEAILSVLRAAAEPLSGQELI